jgi:hypothetical protein
MKPLITPARPRLGEPLPRQPAVRPTRQKSLTDNLTFSIKICQNKNKIPAVYCHPLSIRGLKQTMGILFLRKLLSLFLFGSFLLGSLLFGSFLFSCFLFHGFFLFHLITSLSLKFIFN